MCIRDRDKGIAYLCEFLAMARGVIGKDTPLACDHFGGLSIENAIRLAKAFEPYKLAWAEDIVSWTNWRGLKQISDATETPILTGEDIFGLRGGFDSLIDSRAVDIGLASQPTAAASRSRVFISRCILATAMARSANAALRSAVVARFTASMRSGRVASTSPPMARSAGIKRCEFW